MSLAATLAAEGMRPASFLPAVKCSDCGDEIEIVAMGDHICAKAPASPAASAYQSVYMANPFTMSSKPMNNNHLPMNANGLPATSPLQYSQPANPSSPQLQTRTTTPMQYSQPPPPPSIRAPRPAPPRINPDAANNAYLPKPSRSDSPLSPAMSSRSGSSQGGRPHMMRNATTPVPRIQRPPSPEMSSNLDCAFPIFPANAPTPTTSRPATADGRRTPSSDRAPSRANSRQDSGMANDRVPFNFNNKGYTNEPEAFRADTPTDNMYDNGRRRPSEPQVSPLDRRRPSLSNVHAQAPPPVPSEPVPRPSTSGSMSSRRGSNFSRPGPPQPLKQTPPYRPDRPADDVLSPRFLDQLSEEPSSSMPPHSAPSSHFSTSTSPDQAPPGMFPERNDSGHSDYDSRGRRRPSLGTVLEHPPAPPTQFRARSSSRSAPRVDYRMQDAPPVPKPVQQYRGEIMHTPSESGSSTMSSFNFEAMSTRGSSPVDSAASSVDVLSPLSSVVSSHFGEEEHMKPAGLNVKNKSKPSAPVEEPGLRAEQPSQKSPPRNFARPAPSDGPMQSPPSQNSPPPQFSPGLESPMDPALQNQRFVQAPIQYPARPPLNRVATAPLPMRTESPGSLPPLPSPLSQRDFSPMSRQGTPDHLRHRANSPLGPNNQYNDNLPPPPPIPQEAQRSQSVGRRGTASKPNCRGCGQKIEGKSVKAADGRLTGRWHKACFTCKTCVQPFTTADFYVIDDHPFCEQHYHEKNGSLCHGCHRGIEGQYLETTSSSAIGTVDRKFHPRCFTCVDCRLVLSDDYFEIHGRVYCERHALAAMRVQQGRMAGPGGMHSGGRQITAERRTTRLMMM